MGLAMSLSTRPAAGVPACIVRPLGGRRESLGLLATALAVVAALAGYVALRPQKVAPPRAAELAGPVL